MPERRPKRGILVLGLTAATVVLTLSVWALYSNHDSKRGQVVAGTNSTAGMSPTGGMSPTAGLSRGAFQPRVPNRGDAPGLVPEGSMWMPGGEFSMGATDPPDREQLGMKATP